MISNIKFNMLPFIMFDYLPGLGHENNFKHSKQYISPCLNTKKDKEKGVFWPLVQLQEKRGNMGYARSGVV